MKIKLYKIFPHVAHLAALALHGGLRRGLRVVVQVVLVVSGGGLKHEHLRAGGRRPRLRRASRGGGVRIVIGPEARGRRRTRKPARACGVRWRAPSTPQRPCEGTGDAWSLSGAGGERNEGYRRRRLWRSGTRGGSGGGGPGTSGGWYREAGPSGVWKAGSRLVVLRMVSAWERGQKAARVGVRGAHGVRVAMGLRVVVRRDK